MTKIPVHLDILRAFWLFFSSISIILGLWKHNYFFVIFGVVVFAGAFLLKNRPSIGRIVLLVHFTLQTLVTPIIFIVVGVKPIFILQFILGGIFIYLLWQFQPNQIAAEQVTSGVGRRGK